MGNNELLSQIAELIEQSEERTAQRMKELETRLHLKIENDVSRKIEALFDGYKLTHEKQWEMERELEQIKVRLDRLESAI